ncbi:GtrA family protein [Dyella humicola]|uniref:GtrA family protein n=1 Tax=Dyella humicola TaxID=2992126 RepID=UPI0022512749|nr:GtrA family protein [Dyella humicola]
MLSMPLRDRLAGRLAAFSLAGVANTLIGISAIVLCGMLGVGAMASNVVGYAIGLVVSFTLNSRVTFHDRPRDRHTVSRFLAAFGIAFAANLGVVSLAMHHLALDHRITSLAGTPAYMVVFFVLCEIWVFKVSPEVPS